MLAYTPVEFKYLEILAETFLIPARQNQFIQETITTMLQFVGFLLQGIQSLHALDHILKIHCDINNLISDKLEYSDEVIQS